VASAVVAWTASTVPHSSLAFVVPQNLINESSGKLKNSYSVNKFQSSRTSSSLLYSSSSGDAVDDDDNKDEDDKNPWTAFVRSILPTNKSTVVVETEEERRVRLLRERRAFLAEGELLRQARVKEDRWAYLVLGALQFLPWLGTDRPYSLAYFLGVAVLTVYVGGRQLTLVPPERVTKENALAAPVGASVSIGLLYVLIKYGIFDPSTLYAVAVSIFGVLCVSDVGVPLLRNVFPSLAEPDAEVSVPPALARTLGMSSSEVVENDDELTTLPLDGLLALGIGVLCAAIYWSPAAMSQKYIISNILAWSLAVVSLGSISLGAFQTGVILLAGLFFYDIFWVFGTDVMMTVATKVEAPVKFLYQAPPQFADRPYPFSVLGLGDVVVPGLFVRFLAQMDDALKPTKVSYFQAGTVAYALGLSVCFAVNEITKSGQPALLYLDPACIGSALLAATANGQLPEVWNFEEPTVADGEETTMNGISK